MSSFFDDTASRPIADGPIGDGAEQTSQHSQQIEASQHPIAPRQSVGGDVFGFGLEHQFGNIDAGGALEPAHLAIHAEVSHALELIAMDQLRIELAGENPAHEIGFGAR